MDQRFDFSDVAPVSASLALMANGATSLVGADRVESALDGLMRAGASLLFLIEIQNLPHVAVAYGAAAASEVATLVHAALAAVPGCRGVVALDPNFLVLALPAPAGGMAHMGGDLDDHAEIDSVMRDIGLHGFRQGDASIHLALSMVGRAFEPDGPITTADLLSAMADALRLRRGPLAPPRATAAWAHAYRQDMKAAAGFYAAARAGRIVLAYQPVVEPAEDWKVLYYECLARMIEPDGTLCMPGSFIPALERLNLMRGLDHHIARLVLNELGASPSITLGFNISAQSALLDGWWSEVMRRLAGQPDLARRLVIEVTETSFFHSISSAIDFCEQMRTLGCRLAIDDFGVGFASLRYLTAFSPDMIKVDAFYVRRLKHGEREQATLKHLIALATSFAATVIVEGIETGTELTRTLLAGAHFLQGYQINVPILARPWAFGEDVRFAPALRPSVPPPFPAGQPLSGTRGRQRAAMREERSGHGI